MLAMAEPMALPMAMPDSPCQLAVADTESSGAVVARLTRVVPMTMRGTRRWLAMDTLDSTKYPPLRISSAMLATKTRIARRIALSFRLYGFAADAAHSTTAATNSASDRRPSTHGTPFTNTLGTALTPRSAA